MYQKAKAPALAGEPGLSCIHPWDQHEGTVTKNTPKTQVGLTGNMTRKGADRVGLVLALAALIFAACAGAALIAATLQ